MSTSMGELYLCSLALRFLYSNLLDFSLRQDLKVEAQISIDRLPHKVYTAVTVSVRL